MNTNVSDQKMFTSKSGYLRNFCDIWSQFMDKWGSFDNTVEQLQKTKTNTGDGSLPILPNYF